MRSCIKPLLLKKVEPKGMGINHDLFAILQRAHAYGLGQASSFKSSIFFSSMEDRTGKSPRRFPAEEPDRTISTDCTRGREHRRSLLWAVAGKQPQGKHGHAVFDVLRRERRAPVSSSSGKNIHTQLETPTSNTPADRFRSLQREVPDEQLLRRTGVPTSYAEFSHALRKTNATNGLKNDQGTPSGSATPGGANTTGKALKPQDSMRRAPRRSGFTWTCVSYSTSNTSVPIHNKIHSANAGRLEWLSLTTLA